MDEPTHEFDPECAVCQIALFYGVSHEEAMRRIHKQDTELIKKYGWVAHLITDSDLVHTHGLQETYGHMDFEIKLPLPRKMLHQFLSALANAVKAGEVFHADETSLAVFECPVRFVERTEAGRRVLRAIFPDRHGHWPGEPDCVDLFAHQIED